MTSFSKLVTSETPVKMEDASGGKTGALIATYENGVKAIVKSMKEKMPNNRSKQRGIPASSHPMREVAFRKAAELLGFADLVPETVLTTKAVEGVVSSAQLFVPAHHLSELQPKLRDVDDKDWGHLFQETCSLVPKKFWKNLLALDILAGVRDRHSNNVGLLMRSDNDRPVYRLIAWDNAVSFGRSFDQYHNVFHKYLFRRSVDLGETWTALDNLKRGELHDALGEYLTSTEIDDAYLRVEFFRSFPYRLPWKVCSKGNDDPHEFPSYETYFQPVVSEPLHLLRMSACG